MLAVYFLLLLIPCTYSSITVSHIESKENLQACVDKVLKNYFEKKIITYVDMGYDGDDILKVINNSPANMITKKDSKQQVTFNLEYVITAGTAKDFTTNFPPLMKERRCNPYAIFLIIVKSLKAKELWNMFDALLKYQVNNVLIINGTNEAEMFTYNPFDNYNCGKKYDDTIPFGNCLNSSVKELYPNKLVTGLRNCSFKATIANWPPYAIDQKTSNDSMVGVEQYLFYIISKLEGFEVTFTDSINGEDFSTIEDNITSGHFPMLLNKQTDFIFGGMLLVDFRADLFNFICGHLPFMDDIRIFVKKAGPITGWKNLVLEFDCTVWILLIVTFFIYFLLLLITVRVKHKTSLFLAMLDLLFLHGNKMVSKLRGVFIFWVIYAYLINSYYQSSLVSITANPIANYQVSKFEDLKKYNVEDCISTVIQKYILTVRSNVLEKLHYREGCMYLRDSMWTVSKTNNKFTVSLYSLYLYNKYLLYNEKSEDPIYAFKDPINAVIYAIYFRKGFPLQDRLNMHAIRMRENGLIDKFLNLLYHKRQKLFVKTLSSARDRHFCVIFPWYILVGGMVIAIGLFILELFSAKCNRLNTIL